VVAWLTQHDITLGAVIVAAIVGWHSVTMRRKVTRIVANLDELVANLNELIKLARKRDAE